ncbi:MAG TPA: hypothetical protein VH701_28365, partial [Vicinamibacterales bacterium]
MLRVRRPDSSQQIRPAAWLALSQTARPELQPPVADLVARSLENLAAPELLPFGPSEFALGQR